MKTDCGVIKRAVQSVDDESVDCSDDSLQDICDLVKAAPDIREDRVSAAKKALARGALPLGGEDLVDKVLRSMF